MPARWNTLLALVMMSAAVGCQRPIDTTSPAVATTSMTAPRPMTPQAKDALRVLSRLSPENTLPWLKRSDIAPIAPEECIVVTIDTWSQSGVTDGYMRKMCFDPRSDRLWIIESGGITGATRWYGAARVVDDALLTNADGGVPTSSSTGR
jgi:hypothetical protein